MTAATATRNGIASLDVSPGKGFNSDKLMTGATAAEAQLDMLKASKNKQTFSMM
jgi:hypothetical protein